VEFVLLNEGQAYFWGPDLNKYSDPASAPVFYNPLMERNRTISVLAVEAFGELADRGLVVCEPLSGTGGRGIRYAKETKVVDKVIFNDISIDSYNLIKKNIELNNINAEVYNEDANILLLRLKRRCDVVDVDPFGSPAPFLHAAFKALKDGGMLCATATDTAVLVGKYRSKCLRRYGSRISKTPFGLEMGLRNLLGFIARVGAMEDVVVEPLLAYWERHYFRVCVRAYVNAREASDVFAQLGYVVYENGYRFVAKNPGEHANGPLWIGDLGDPLFVLKMSERASGELKNFLEALAAEYSIDAPWFYTVSEFARNGRVLPLDEALERMERGGIIAVRTHFSREGFKTDAQYGELKRALWI